MIIEAVHPASNCPFLLLPGDRRTRSIPKWPLSLKLFTGPITRPHNLLVSKASRFSELFTSDALRVRSVSMNQAERPHRSRWLYRKPANVEAFLGNLIGAFNGTGESTSHHKCYQLTNQGIIPARASTN